ncbi:1,4-dihydroxy-2-naphthoate polyprenyltransferase [Clostridium folliculivorans]|uniref:1,4-dihydroxy-2-naphthoate octaprenyltransferase n=1 Tax=Clostridium folliculivorans TaxID=2886038 RepID=A0A9W5Y5A5_9CLOT|nr:1,4-dihydroxy-2-naphthoate polyprenyltransferase [Clostridium folliculivorans]GKU26991.1 1,4-dihydroxy-2-naphthoate octaprenyltransferase [Clostridium folliculivorans]GKU29167.1 1,4-dihydroxy-2-naphthoate octaprenyltransferase [Clostridium folliculivorans]
MSISKFFELVEIKTKLASVIPFSLGSAFAIYRYKSFNLKNFIIMFISLICFDMATTAINNYIDNTKAKNSSENNSLLTKYGANKSKVLLIIFILLAIATTAGIMLTLNTNIIVLLIGIISFIVGIFYTFGPIPISRMPLGEVFSGFFMGFVIIFLSVYIHIFDTNIISFTYQNNILSVGINLLEIGCIFLFSIPAIGGIANIMLANNICDVEEDIKNNRFTLPYYIGRPMALKLFKLLYYIGYVDIVLLALLKVIPLASLFVLITLIKVNKNIKLLQDRPIKNENFVVSVKNFLLINTSQVIIMIFIVMASK